MIISAKLKRTYFYSAGSGRFTHTEIAGCKSVNLSWSGSLPPGTLYNIYRTSNSSTCGTPLLLGTTTLTHFTDLSSLTRGTTYSYTIQIKDYCSGCTSNESNCASITIPSCPAMSTPSLSYAVNGSTVTLTWNQITNAESYEVWRSTGGTYIRIALLDSSTLTYTDYNLAPLTYSYKVKAVTQCDCSKDSNTVEVTITGGSSSISPALYYHEDHLGTIRLITDGSGTIVSIHDYEPFGTEIPPLSYSENTHRFTGHERDSATGNDYMINRFYSAGMGRFTRTDPVSGSSGNPQSWNLYTYVMNNPVNSNDPKGLTLQYSDDFRNRLKNDPIFKMAFKIWKKTEIGNKQWKAMKKDIDTVYKLDIGRTYKESFVQKKEQTFANTNYGWPTSKVTEKVNQPNIYIRINIDFHEEKGKTTKQTPEETAKEVAETIFHEGLHASDFGSGEKTWGEAYQSSRVLDKEQQSGDPTGEDKRMEEFMQEMADESFDFDAEKEFKALSEEYRNDLNKRLQL